MSMLIRLIVIALFANWCLPLSAQTLIKCKQPNGSYSFQDTPCASSANQETLKVDPRGGLKPVPSASQDASGTTTAEPKSTASRLPPTAAPAPTPTPDPVRSPATERTPEPTADPTPEPAAPTISRIESEIKSQPDATSDREKAMPDTGTESEKSYKSDSSGMGTGKIILLLIGAVIVIICSIWILILAFQESALWGLLCFFISFPCQLIFTFTHWDKCKTPFLISIGGYVVMIFALII